MYASFGSQVTLVEAEPRLLPGEPAFAGEILAVALRRAGAEIRLGSRATKAERTADGLTLALEDGTRIDAARLLLASGRRPRLGGLGLAEVAGPPPRPGHPDPLAVLGAGLLRHRRTGREGTFQHEDAGRQDRPRRARGR